MYGIALYSIEETAQDNWQQNLFGNKFTIDHMIINVKLILLVHSVCWHSYLYLNAQESLLVTKL